MRNTAKGAEQVAVGVINKNESGLTHNRHRAPSLVLVLVLVLGGVSRRADHAGRDEE